MNALLDKESAMGIVSTGDTIKFTKKRASHITGSNIIEGRVVDKDQ